MDLNYFALSGWGRMGYKLKRFFAALPNKIGSWFANIGKAIKAWILSIGAFFVDMVKIIKTGSVGTKMSFFVMGFGCMTNGQIVRGIVYFLVQVVFIVYMVVFGWAELINFTTLGTTLGEPIFDELTGLQIGTTESDNSLTILLFSVMTLIFLGIVLYLYIKSIRNSYSNDCLRSIGKKPDGFGQDVSNLLDKNFHTTLLFAPTAGVVIFTIIPLIFMILIAFTNYDYSTQPPGNLFTWVGFDNFIDMFTGSVSSNASINASTFLSILGWTLVWAVLSTVTTYIGGIVLALMINKKGIFGKKIYRNMFVLTIAVPQFVSLLVISKFLGDNGLVNTLMLHWGWISTKIPFLSDIGLARTTVVVVNMWVGIPYTMLSMTGILMNIPEDLYEAAKIDGANAFKMFMKITLPYMLVVTGPYLITQFIGNINNFNVIFLLTGGSPVMNATAGHTDLLITWLYNITINGTYPDYKMGSVIGILVFAVCSASSLIAYRYVGSQQKEEVFQ